MTKEEFTKMKQELEAWVTFICTPVKMLHWGLVSRRFWVGISCTNALLCFSEYLAIFKKTVAMHEVFLCRVAAHPILRKDLNFHVFLEYNQDVSVLIKVFYFLAHLFNWAPTILREIPIFWSRRSYWCTSTSCENNELGKTYKRCDMLFYFHFHLFACFGQWQLSVRGKNKKEKLEDFFKNVVKSADGVLVAGVKVSHVNVMRRSCGLSDDVVGNDLPAVAWNSYIDLNVFLNNHSYMKATWPSALWWLALE